MGGTTLCLNDDNLENLLKKISDTLKTYAEASEMFPDSDLIVKDDKGKEYVFEAKVTEKSGWVKPLPDFSKNKHYEYFDELEKFTSEQSSFLFECLVNGKDPQKDYPISLKQKRRQLLNLFKYVKKKIEPEGDYFDAFSDYNHACNKGRFEVVIYSKQFKHANRLLPNQCAEAVVSLYYKETIGKFQGAIHLHT